MKIESVTVGDGKYTITNDNGRLTALRNGEPWDRDLVGDNLVYWMMVRIQELEAAVKDAVGGDEPVGWQYRETRDDGTWSAWIGCCVRLEENDYRQCRPLYTRPQASAAVPEDAIDAVSKAMTKAWQLGQDYWRQADGDTQAEWDESGHTEVRFQTLLDETTSMLAAKPEVKS